MKKFKLICANKKYSTKDFKYAFLSFLMVGALTVTSIPIYLTAEKHENKRILSGEVGIAQCIRCSNDQEVNEAFINRVKKCKELRIDGEQIVKVLLSYSDQNQGYYKSFLIKQEGKEDTYIIDGYYFSEIGDQVVYENKFVDNENETIQTLKTKSYDDLMEYELKVYVDDNDKVDSVLIKK